MNAAQQVVATVLVDFTAAACVLCAVILLGVFTWRMIMRTRGRR